MLNYIRKSLKYPRLFSSDGVAVFERCSKRLSLLKVVHLMVRDDQEQRTRKEGYQGEGGKRNAHRASLDKIVTK